MNKAKLYQRSNELQRVDTKLVLSEYAPLIKWNGFDTVMDVGCGTGDVTVDFLLPEIPTTYLKLVGTDISDSMIRYANETYQNLPRVSFERLDISGAIDAKFLNYFDHVTSFFCLHWVQNQKYVISV